MSTGGPIRLATRGSQLARRQAGRVGDRLDERRYDVELVEVSTRGDEIRDELIHELGRKGAFVRSVDEAVLADEADAAIHSLKDVPTEGGDDIVIAAIPQRETATDVLVTPDGTDFTALPKGATVGTASQRRGAQIHAARPGLTVEPIRGNVDTRIEKLLAPHLQAQHERLLEANEAADDSGEEVQDPSAWFDERTEIERQALGRNVDTQYDGLVLAAAGLKRLGLADQVPTEALPTNSFVPSPGQGAIAVTAPPGDLADRLRRALDHPPTRVAVTTERTVMAELGGGCIAPIGVYATVRGPTVNVVAQVLAADGDETLTESREIPVEHHREGAKELAADLADRGARTLIEEATADQ